jgi:microcystin-dependent protein
VSDQFLAEIRIFPFNFPPTGWAFCNGQLMPISQNTALFSLLGTYYGGDGKSTFALPNLQGTAPMQQGQGQGLSLYDLGQSGGSDTVTLLGSEMPVHTHSAMADSQDPGNVQTPDPQVVLARSSPFVYKAPPVSDAAPMAPQALSPTGSSSPHNNLMPYLTLNFCIALQGVFPPRG